MRRGFRYQTRQALFSHMADEGGIFRGIRRESRRAIRGCLRVADKFLLDVGRVLLLLMGQSFQTPVLKQRHSAYIHTSI